MNEWNLALLAPQLKAKQELLQTALTKTFDMLNGLKEEIARLKDNWEGQAGDIYCASFEKELSKGYECAGKMSELIASLAEAEREFENCEAEIMSLIG